MAIGYSALVHPAQDGSCVVEFPDCLGCPTFSTKISEASGRARALLISWLSAYDLTNLPRPARRMHEAPVNGWVLELDLER